MWHHLKIELQLCRGDNFYRIKSCLCQNTLQTVFADESEIKVLNPFVFANELEVISEYALDVIVFPAPYHAVHNMSSKGHESSVSTHFLS